MKLPWGGGELVGWNLGAAPPAEREKTLRSYVIQHVHLDARGDLEADRRLLRHPVGGRPLGVLLAQAILEHTEDAMLAELGPPSWRERADAEGFRLGFEDVLDRLGEIEDLRGAVAGPSASAELVTRWLLSDGSVFVAERHPLACDLWRVVQEPTEPAVTHRDIKPANVLTNNGTTTGPTSPETLPSSSHPAGSLPAGASTDRASTDRVALVGAGDSLSSAPAGNPVPVAQLVPEAVARMREAQRVAAEATLAEAHAVLTVAERQLAGGDRTPTQPGIRCCWCQRELGTYTAVFDKDERGGFRWAHKQCAFDETQTERCAYGTAADMRAELGRAAVQLTGGECFHELRSAVLAVRKQDVRSIDWTKKKPVKARAERDCLLCPKRVEKGELCRDAGEGRAAHQLCLEAAGLVTKAEASAETGGAP